MDKDISAKEAFDRVTSLYDGKRIITGLSAMQYPREYEIVKSMFRLERGPIYQDIVIVRGLR